MKEFSILIDTLALERYMFEHGAEEDNIADMHEYVEPFERLDADKLWVIAEYVLLSMGYEQKCEMANDYGCSLRDESNLFRKYTDEIIGHVADEILANCCRTVLDY